MRSSQVPQTFPVLIYCVCVRVWFQFFFSLSHRKSNCSECSLSAVKGILWIIWSVILWGTYHVLPTADAGKKATTQREVPAWRPISSKRYF